MTTYATWNPSDKAADIALTGSNLIATAEAGGHRLVRATVGLDAGLVYLEITANTVGGNGLWIGIGDTAAPTDQYVGYSSNGYGYYTYNGKKWNNHSEAAYGGAVSNGQVVGVAVNFTTHKVWWSVDDVWQGGGDPEAGTGEAFSTLSGTLYIMASFYDIDDQVTLNAGASAFAGTVPSGFASGWSEAGDTEISLAPYPLSVSTAGAVTLQLDLPVPALSVTAGLEMSGVVVGKIIYLAGYPLSVATAGATTLQLDMPVPALSVSTAGATTLQLDLPVPALSVTAGMSVADVFNCYLLTFDPLSVSTAGAATLQLDLPVPALSVATAGATTLQLDMPVPALSVTAGLEMGSVGTVDLAGSARQYTFTLTGATDGTTDVTIPISSFQSRIRSGDPTYLSVVIPSYDYAAVVAARSSGELVLKMRYIRDGEVLVYTEISRASLEDITTDRGASSESITLVGHKTTTFSPKAVNLTGTSYINLSDDSLRYRCSPDLYVRPGDTVTVGDDTFTVGEISWTVSVDAETFEVAEA